MPGRRRAARRPKEATGLCASVSPQWSAMRLMVDVFRRARQRKTAHVGDLLRLLDDNRLGEALELFIAAIFQQDERHVDRTLMMRDHHPHEVLIDIAARRDIHALMHPRIDLRHFRIEGRVGGIRRDRTGMVMTRLDNAGRACQGEACNEQSGKTGHAQRGSRGALSVYCPLFGDLAQKIPGSGATYCLDSVDSCTCSVDAEAVK